MDEILITGEVVSLRSVSEVRKISTQEFYESLSASVGMMTPILPPQVIFYGSLDRLSVYVTHRMPGQREIKVKIENDEWIFNLKFPHLYFFHLYHYSAFEDLYVYGSNAPAYSPDHMLCRLPLRNLFSDGRVCLGDDLKFDLEGRLAGKIARVENYFWNSVFNRDLQSIYQAAAPPGWRGDPLEHWQRLSHNDNFDPCTENWLTFRSWKEMVNILLGRET